VRLVVVVLGDMEAAFPNFQVLRQELRAMQRTLYGLGSSTFKFCYTSRRRLVI
jgi:hypothetical protein